MSYEKCNMTFRFSDTVNMLVGMDVKWFLLKTLSFKNVVPLSTKKHIILYHFLSSYLFPFLEKSKKVNIQLLNT